MGVQEPQESGSRGADVRDRDVGYMRIAPSTSARLKKPIKDVATKQLKHFEKICRQRILNPGAYDNIVHIKGFPINPSAKRLSSFKGSLHRMTMGHYIEQDVIHTIGCQMIDTDMQTIAFRWITQLQI